MKMDVQLAFMCSWWRDTLKGRRAVAAQEKQIPVCGFSPFSWSGLFSGGVAWASAGPLLSAGLMAEGLLLWWPSPEGRSLVCGRTEVGTSDVPLKRAPNFLFPREETQLSSSMQESLAEVGRADGSRPKISSWMSFLGVSFCGGAAVVGLKKPAHCCPEETLPEDILFILSETAGVTSFLLTVISLEVTKLSGWTRTLSEEKLWSFWLTDKTDSGASTSWSSGDNASPVLVLKATASFLESICSFCGGEASASERPDFRHGKMTPAWWFFLRPVCPGLGSGLG